MNHTVVYVWWEFMSNAALIQDYSLNIQIWFCELSWTAHNTDLLLSPVCHYYWIVALKAPSENKHFKSGGEWAFCDHFPLLSTLGALKIFIWNLRGWLRRPQKEGGSAKIAHHPCPNRTSHIWWMVGCNPLLILSIELKLQSLHCNSSMG